MTPDQHRAQAEEIRKSAPDMDWLAKEHDRVAMMIDLKVLQTKLDDARQEVRNLTVIAMHPDLTPEKRELVRQLERSARAEVKARQMALEHAKTQAKP